MNGTSVNPLCSKGVRKKLHWVGGGGVLEKRDNFFAFNRAWGGTSITGIWGVIGLGKQVKSDASSQKTRSTFKRASPLRKGGREEAQGGCSVGLKEGKYHRS